MEGFDFSYRLASFRAWTLSFLRKARSFFFDFLKKPLSQKKVIFLFLVAFSVGAGIKSSVNDVLTIGYDDYKLKGSQNTVDINKIQSEMIKNGKPLSLAGSETPRGETCSE